MKSTACTVQVRQGRGMKALCLVATLFVAGCGGGGDDQPPRTTISFRGATGDYISQGESAKYSDVDSTVSTTYSAGYFRASFEAPDLSHRWSIDLASPNGEPLVPGTYVDAWRAAFRNGHNGVDFYGDGRGCNEVFGSFIVLEIGYDSTGRLNRFAADFEQRCETVTSPQLRGSVRINSTISPTYQ
ncbi:hypothetical protein [Methylibium sp. Pch-M]|uniref:hypothetical protein n=1 Tax=Methylibium sp. Pch-M TaxID=2082386 RepID=UPI0010109408|nr:hypothetical protein [Methylibium sp. Pch-M]